MLLVLCFSLEFGWLRLCQFNFIYEIPCVITGDIVYNYVVYRALACSAQERTRGGL